MDGAHVDAARLAEERSAFRRVADLALRDAGQAAVLQAIAAAAIAGEQSRQDLEELAREQAALRRVAELVAEGASRSTVFDAVADEACRLLGGHVTALLRYEPDGAAVVVAVHGAVAHDMAVGMRLPAQGDGLVQRVQRSGQAVRMDSHEGVSGSNAATARAPGSAGVGAPIVTEGRVWGAITVMSSGESPPGSAEGRLGMFAKLLAVAISNAQARTDLAELADEQAALRRVAELVARGVAQGELFETVAVEASRLAEDEATTLVRIGEDRTYTVVAVCGGPAPVGTRIGVAPDDEGIVAEILRTRQPARLDDYGVRSGPAHARDDHGVGSSVGVPIVVDDRVWGILGATTTGRRLPATAERRLGQFAELVAAALANAQARGVAEKLADEQTALRAVAELVARGGAADDVLTAVAAQASGLLDDQPTTLTRFDGERELVVVAVHGGPAPIGARITFEPDTLPDRVRRGGGPVRVDDYARERDAQLAAGFGLRAAVAAPIAVDGEVWGMLTATSGVGPLAAGTETSLQQFAELVAAAIANTQARTQVQQLADEQAALRRVAELAASGASPGQVFDAVVTQASRLVGVGFVALLRCTSDGGTEIIALHGAPDGLTVGTPGPTDGELVQRVLRTGRRSRVDSYSELPGGAPELACGLDFGTGIAAPIHIDGRLWGMLTAISSDDPLPAAFEDRLAEFAAMTATAISGAQHRNSLRELADEQTALRRVAELVARGAPLGEVFAAIATEASMLLGDQAAALLRYDPDEFGTIVAAHNSPAVPGLRVPSDGDTATGRIRRTGRPFRVDSFEGTALADMARRLGVGAAVTVPIMVEGRVWGNLSTSTAGPPPPTDTEKRLAQFAELAAAAIANAENKAKLTASRARVVATADETRRRLQRDVHDAAQQRLVHTIITLKLARDAIAAGGPPADLVHEALTHAERANSDLRDVVRGILPASLTRGGLRAGLESLAADLTVPVDVRVSAPRLPARVEITAYFIVAEALTNVVKHANATRATVDVVTDGDAISIVVHDDGTGGADPANGTGLTGLSDRVDANEGTLTITSPAGRGTTVRAVLALAPPGGAT